MKHEEDLDIRLCEVCEGHGYTVSTVPDHTANCTGDRCDPNCPEPRYEEDCCPECGGTGEKDTIRAIVDIMDDEGQEELW